MMAACMEQKRLGLANKTIMVVPKPLIGQTASEFLRLYPSANILVATERDFEKSRRKQFVSRIATGDYDCIIMSHSQFEKIPISAERKERMLNEQIDEISYAIDEMKERNGERWTVKQMESQKKKLEEQLKSLSDESRKDDLITFEELGVDSIMVDEAHNFKNLAIFSKMNNVAGISSSGAKKSTDMQLKCQYLSEINDGRGIVFATGTPISNTMCEMYVMQLYLQKSALEEMGIYHFDSWAANFGEVTTALELTVEGSGFRFKSRFNKFTNLPELMNIFREVADVQTADMLDLDVPALRGGKPIIVESEPDWYVKQVMEEFVVRAERIRGGGVDPSVDNFLKITHEARLLGTDARLIDKDAPNNPDGKLNKVAENVWKEYVKGNADGHIGCQLIFSDIGTPGPDKDFTIYDYLKESLIKYGIPAEEIAFIHDAKTDAQRDALFKEMRTGKKKVLIGSTDKCGTGVNVQTHLVAMHHVDCPWNPITAEFREELYTNILEAYVKIREPEKAETQTQGKTQEMPEFSVTVTPYEREGSNIKGLARIYFENSFIVNNVNILQGKEKIFVSMPSYKTKQVDEHGKPIYQDVCYPVTKDFREKLYNEIIAEYEKAKDKSNEKARENAGQNHGNPDRDKKDTPFR